MPEPQKDVKPSKWHLDRANLCLMPTGRYKGMRFSLVPLNALRIFSKTYIRKDLRDAALLVLEDRKHEALEKE